MTIKYIVKSATSQSLYLVADTDLGNRKVPFAFKPCTQIIYNVAVFSSKDEALAACEEAAKYDGSIARRMPIILEVILDE